MRLTRVVCLVGSSCFKKTFHQVGERLEKRGVLVLMMSFFQHADRVEVSYTEREKLWEVDQARIRLADEVLVIDPPCKVCSVCRAPCDRDCDTVLDPVAVGPEQISRCHGASLNRVHYVGKDTNREIEYALSLGKPVRYWSKGEVE